MRISTAVFLALAASQLGFTGCEVLEQQNVVVDPGFDLWCGSDALCAWNVERGAIEHAPTWDSADWGIEFEGDDVAIDQYADITSDHAEKIEVDMLADVDAAAEVDMNFYVNAAVDGSGTLAFTERIPTSSWEPASVTFYPDGSASWDGLRVELAKTGSGHAELARIVGTAWYWVTE